VRAVGVVGDSSVRPRVLLRGVCPGDDIVQHKHNYNTDTCVTITQLVAV